MKTDETGAGAADLFTAAGGSTAAADKVPGDNGFDLAALRLEGNFADRVGVKRQLVAVPVRKPHPQAFLRIHPDPKWQLRTAVLADTDSRETYLVGRDLWPALADEISPVILFVAIDRQGNVFLWPAKLPRDDGRASHWHSSALEAAELAKTQWVRVKANMGLGAYDVFVANADGLAEPTWPGEGFEYLVDKAFRDRYIRDTDHPVLRRLRGEE